MKHFLVYNCSFCGSQKIRFDVLYTIRRHIRMYGTSDQLYWQAFSQCSHCKNSSIFILVPNVSAIREEVKFPFEGFIESKDDLCQIESTNINDHFKINRVLITPFRNQIICPLYVPDHIKNIFNEATKCLSFNCFIASGSMFRLCLDLVTKDLLKTWLEENQTSEEQPNKEQRNKLANRIDFLIAQDKIPKRLKELAHCIRHDGNDSAHDGTTGEDEALDCLDFTEALLTEIYTLPEQIKEAEKRRFERRAKSSS